MTGIGKKVFIAGKTVTQRIVITIQFFLGNGLANHAAAGAYGFLLSAAPMLLLVSFFLFLAFQSSPQAVMALVSSIPFLEIVIDQQWLANDFVDFLIITRPGISGLVTVLSIFWAGRILAFSLRRGLKVIFTGTKKRNPLADNLIALVVELLALILTLVMILGSQAALRLYEVFDFFPNASFLHFLSSKIGYRVFRIISLGLVLYSTYRLIPVNPPRRLSALCGAILCVFTFECTVLVLGIMLRQSTFNALYGAFGTLIVLLINVYFFFMLFFLGAQFAFVIDRFDALLFSRLRQSRISTAKKGRVARLSPAHRLFFSVRGNLKKYCHFYPEGEIIFSKGDEGSEIYYILEGEVEVFLLSSQNSGDSANILGPGSFFGEMGYLLSENRSATIRAKTGVSVLALPPRLFDEILRHDVSLDRAIIENLSRRIKSGNDQIEALINEDFQK